MRFITLNMISDSSRHPAPSTSTELVAAPPPAQEPEWDPEDGEVMTRAEPEVQPETTTPVDVNVDAIRAYYTRINSKPGTRITFTDGGGFAVAETVEEVRTLVRPN